jgi:23S rRNA (adenine2503-C2)-methyltransferase
MTTQPHESPPTGRPATERVHVLGEELEALRQWLGSAGHERYRADQIVEWVYGRDADSFDALSNLSRPLRAWLAERADIVQSRVTAESASTDGTRKLLLAWPDGNAVETVWIPEGGRNTVCVSSQVGCPVGCGFCASGLGGLKRDLTAGEIVEQAWRVRRLVRARAGVQSSALPSQTPEPSAVQSPVPRSSTSQPVVRAGSVENGGAPGRLTNVVFMGMGEPLANYDAVLRAIRILNASWGLNVGARKITLSTVGLPKQIRRLADEGLQLNLALSLHAPDEALRHELIPWSKAPLSALLDACAYYFDRTGREITLEYVLLDGVNMAPRHAAKLAAIVRRLRCNVNLLRYNPVPGLAYQRPGAEAARAFQEELRDRGVNAHLRASRGPDIEAACGQLRRRTL